MQTSNDFINDAIARITRINTAIANVQAIAIEYDKVMRQILDVQRDVTTLQRYFEDLARTVTPGAPAVTPVPSAPAPTRAPMSMARTAADIFKLPEAPVAPAQGAQPPADNQPTHLPPVRFERDMAALQAAGAHLQDTLQRVKENRPAGDQPTPETAIPTHQPTPEAPREELQHLGERTLNMTERAALAGPTSLWRKLLSPAVIPNGKGFIQPGYASLVQYTQDVLNTQLGQLTGWPTGFYRNGKTGNVQLFINTQDKGLVIIDNVANIDQVPAVLITPEEGWKSAHDMTPLECNHLVTAVIEYAGQLEAENRQLHPEQYHQGDPA